MCRLSQQISNLLERKTPSLQGSSTVKAAIEMMDAHEVDFVGVECEGDFVGVFTRKEFDKNVIRRNLLPEETTLYEVAFLNPPIVQEDITVKEAYSIMMSYQQEFLPVLNEKKLTGIISIRILSEYIMRAYEKSEEENRMIVNYMQRGESYGFANYDQ